ncbi:MAG: hypothetical protein NC299_17670 [Lachnospiraceae bacterium]|nr:hypothetical protein [Lachnospiraceae bacterium]
MKRQIRHGVFETNSSSMHSLVIQKNDEYVTHEEIIADYYYWRDKDKILFLRNDSLEFGRTPFKCLASFIDKLGYAIASFCKYNDEKFDEIIQTVTEIIPECKGIELPLVSTSRYEHKPYYGYVDHESDDLLETFLEKHNVSLKEFLTNKKYVVIVDGDEYCIWDKLKLTGLVNTDIIDYEYPKRDKYGIREEEQ